MIRTLALTVLALTASAAAAPIQPNPHAPAMHFRSRPDLRPPPVRVLTRAGRTAPGYIFIAPKKNVVQPGPLILDDYGHVVWFQPLNAHAVTDFRMQHYRGQPVLTWWRARPLYGEGQGSYTIADMSYRTIARVRPGNGLVGDIHEFLVTPRNTALMTIFHRVRVKSRDVAEGVVQEVDIGTGRVLFEWHSIDHVRLLESYYRLPRDPSQIYDYFHINSIDVDTDGNLLVSARNTHAVYKISKRTGEILWRLGGKRSDFALGRGVRFAWQHDARRLPDGTISLFDNEAAPQVRRQSRGLILRLDLKRKRALLVRTYVHIPPLVCVDQGNMQRLPEAHFLIGWGHQPYVTEFGPQGRMLLDLRFGRGGLDSYRAYRFPWVGRPRTRPAVVVENGRAFMSWNGATEVKRWQLLEGPEAGRLHVARVVPKTGFETAVVVPGDPRFVAVRALDRRGRSLAISRVRRLG